MKIITKLSGGFVPPLYIQMLQAEPMIMQYNQGYPTRISHKVEPLCRDDSRVRERANHAIFEGVGTFSSSSATVPLIIVIILLLSILCGPFRHGMGPLLRIRGGGMWPHFPKF